MAESFRYNGIKLSWYIQETVLNKNPFCVSYKKFYLKDRNKNAHWVGHTKL